MAIKKKKEPEKKAEPKQKAPPAGVAKLLKAWDEKFRPKDVEPSEVWLSDPYNVGHLAQFTTWMHGRVLDNTYLLPHGEERAELIDEIWEEQKNDVWLHSYTADAVPAEDIDETLGHIADRLNELKSWQETGFLNYPVYLESMRPQ